jgi:transcriptional regulator with XRE-family HTH domain
MDTVIFDLDALRILAGNIEAYMKLYEIENVEALAVQCGTTKAQVYAILRGATTPKIDFIDKMAKGMGITAAQILTEGYFDQFEKKIVKKKT